MANKLLLRNLANYIADEKNNFNLWSLDDCIVGIGCQILNVDNSNPDKFAQLYDIELKIAYHLFYGEFRKINLFLFGASILGFFDRKRAVKVLRWLSENYEGHYDYGK